MVLVRLAKGSAPTIFACCCIAKVRLAMRSLFRLLVAMPVLMWPTNVIVMPRIITATITSMSDRPRRGRGAKRVAAEFRIEKIIIASLHLNHARLRDTDTLREAIRRQRNGHRVGRETVG